MSYTTNLIDFDATLNKLIEESGLQIDLLYYIFKSKANQLKALCFKKDKEMLEEELLKLQNFNNSPSTEDQIK